MIEGWWWGRIGRKMKSVNGLLLRKHYGDELGSLRRSSSDEGRQAEGWMDHVEQVEHSMLIYLISSRVFSFVFFFAFDGNEKASG